MTQPVKASLFGVAVAIIVGVMGLFFGAADIEAAEVLKHLGSVIGLSDSLEAPTDTILSHLRAPRVLLGLLVGAALGASGASYQGVFRNELADPYLLGVSAGAGLGATGILVLVDDPSNWMVVITAFAASLFAVGIVTAVGKASGNSAASLLLAGVAVAAFAGSAQTALMARNRDASDEVFFCWGFSN